MGDRIPPDPPDIPPPPPPPPGDPCVNCWGVGKPFGEGDTPDEVIAYVSGILHGPNWYAGAGEAPEGLFVLTQNPIIPCDFVYEVLGLPTIGVFFDDDETVMLILNPLGDFVFLTFGGICDTFFNNDENDIFVEGSVLLTIPEPLI